MGNAAAAADAAVLPERQVRAAFNSDHLTVYQAFRPDIAEAAVAAGTFVAPFSLDRMTWIKPSFTWMMYRCGWATKPGQERVLAVRIARSAFDRALAASCLSHFDPAVHGSHAQWQEGVRRTQVRVQWDPERSLDLTRLPWRTIQIGLSGAAVAAYVREWIVDLTDVTDLTHAVHRLVESGDVHGARALLPVEAAYPLPPDAAAAVGAAVTGGG
jgi:hypothetical protein